MSLFVRLDVGFWTHRKTLRMRALLGEAALWLPPRLWSYAAQNQPDGDFSAYLPEELGMLVGFTGDPQAMLQAFQQAGFMDGMKLHGWAERNGFHQKFADRAKKAARARWEKKGDKKTGEREEKRREEASNASSMDKQCLEHKDSELLQVERVSKSKGTKDQVQAFFRTEGLTELDALWFFEKCEGCGWTNNGKPIKDWKSTVRAWRLKDYLPSQKAALATKGSFNGHPKDDGMFTCPSVPCPPLPKDYAERLRRENGGI